MGRSEKFIQFVRDIAADDSHGYSQINRWGKDYDCSSLMLSALNHAYGTSYTSGYTGTMRKQFEAAGWTWHPYYGDPYPVPVGAVMLNERHHTECVVDWDHLGGAHIDENGDIVGRLTGDQTGNEISIVPWYDYWAGWDGWLAPPADPAPAPAEVTPTPTSNASVDTVAKEVIAGLYGNNPERQAAITKKYGSDFYSQVEARVNEIALTWKSNASGAAVNEDAEILQLAWKVIRGEYGVMPDREKRLGDKYKAVQAKVNKLKEEGAW